MLPLTATASKIEFEVYRHRNATDEQFEKMKSFYSTIMEEDRHLCNASQRNLNSGVYFNGELHPDKEKVGSVLKGRHDSQLIMPGPAPFPTNSSRRRNGPSKIRDGIGWSGDMACRPHVVRRDGVRQARRGGAVLLAAGSRQVFVETRSGLVNPLWFLISHPQLSHAEPQSVCMYLFQANRFLIEPKSRSLYLFSLAIVLITPSLNHVGLLKWSETWHKNHKRPFQAEATKVSSYILLYSSLSIPAFNDFRHKREY